MYPFNSYYNTYQQPQQLQYVNGIESARAYQMPPNSQQILMDNNRARFYLVATDAAGVKSVDAYDFTQAAQPKELDMSQYVTRAEFDEWRAAHEPIANKRAGKSAKADDAGI